MRIVDNILHSSIFICILHAHSSTKSCKNKKTGIHEVKKYRRFVSIGFS